LFIQQISQLELEEAQRAVGEFGGDNRAGIEGTLHRISAIRSRKGLVVGLTCRVGRAVNGHVDMVRDLLNYKESILFLGRYVALLHQYLDLHALSNSGIWNTSKLLWYL
jgi:stage III sporulation protein SpoIIIAA